MSNKEIELIDGPTQETFDSKDQATITHMKHMAGRIGQWAYEREFFTQQSLYIDIVRKDGLLLLRATENNTPDEEQYSYLQRRVSVYTYPAHPYAFEAEFQCEIYGENPDQLLKVNIARKGTREESFPDISSVLLGYFEPDLQLVYVHLSQFASGDLWMGTDVAQGPSEKTHLLHVNHGAREWRGPAWWPVDIIPAEFETIFPKITTFTATKLASAMIANFNLPGTEDAAIFRRDALGLVKWAANEH